MSYLAQSSQTDPSKCGQVIVIAGQEGIGKTELVSGASRRLFVPLEMNGSKRPHSVPRLTTYEQCLDLLDECIAAAQAGTFIYESIVWDSVTALEKLIDNYTIRMDPSAIKATRENKPLPAKLSMATAHDAYGKAYDWSTDRFKEFLEKCDLLAYYAGINTIFTCHVFTERVVDPQAGEFDMVQILLHSPKNSKTAGKREALTQRADAIFYMHSPILVNKGEKFSQAIDAGMGRVLLLDRTPSAVAKNRYGLTGVLPVSKENGWNEMSEAVFNATKGEVDLFNRD